MNTGETMRAFAITIMAVINSTEVFYHLPIGKRCFRFMLLVLLVFVVGGSRTRVPKETEVEKFLGKLNKPAVKTIQSEDGDIVDCVDIYKQPAFDHPLLKNHSIVMRPSFFPEVKEDIFYLEVTVKQIWQRSGSCPNRTIPIRRIQKSDLLKASFLEHGGLSIQEPKNCKIQIAGAVAIEQQPYYGVKAYINVWDLLVMNEEWSLNSIAAVNNQSLVEAGWGVSPSLFFGSGARIFANWRDGEKGCYNLWCSGFIQVSNKVSLGAALSPLSTYGDKQYGVKPKIYKDHLKEQWWLSLNHELVGYWPMSLVPQLAFAQQVQWLGKVCDTELKGYHTTTQMGSGFFPSDGYRKSSFFKNVSVKVNSTGATFLAPNKLIYTASLPSCYDVKEWEQGSRFFYGGPGGPCCDGRC